MASPLRRKVIETFQRYRTPLNMGIELPTIEAIKRFVAMGNGVALVPHLTVARELETGELVRDLRRRAGDAPGAAPGPSPPGDALLRRQGLSAHAQDLARKQQGRHSITTWNGQAESDSLPVLPDPVPLCLRMRLRLEQISSGCTPISAVTRSGHLQC